jgi:Regulator of chromosome condensation (RCC1) repeat
VVAIAAGTVHSLALKANGTVVAWGDDGDGQTDVPSDLTNVVAIAAGGFNSLALKADGTLVSWGDTSAEQTVPAGLNNVMAVSAGYLHTLALVPFSITNSLILDITNGVAQTNSVLPGNIVFYRVNVPTNVDFTTNILIYATNGAVNVWYTTNEPPSIGATNDAFLFASTNDAAILGIGGTPPLVPGSIYYLGINNTNGFAVNYGVEVDFHFVTATNTPPQTNTVPISTVTSTNGGFLLTWFAPSNDLFMVQFTDTLFPAVWQSFSNIISYNPSAYTNNPLNAQFNFFDDGSEYPFMSGRYYRLILLGTPGTNNTPPTLPTQTTRIINPLSQLVVTNIATDADVPAQTLTYTLISTVTGTNQPVMINGVITWTPDISQAGTSNLITTIVTDSGTPNLKATNSFAVIVTPMAGISSVVYTNGNFLLTWFAPSNELFQVQSSDTLFPANWLAFTNIVSYNPLFPATATNAQFNFLDDGTQHPFTSGRYYRLILLGSGSVTPGTNSPPVLPGQTNQVANPLNTLIVTNTATDALGHALSYTLINTLTGTNLPVINPTNGVIIWTPALSQGGVSNFLTTIVTDVSVPTLRATNTFAIIVNPVPTLNSVTYTNGDFLLKWFAPTNDIFQVQFSDSLAPIVWQSFTNGNHVTYNGPLTATNGVFTFLDNGIEHPFNGLRFYQVNLIGVVSQVIAPPTLATNALAISNLATNGNFQLTWLGSTNQQFQVQWATNFLPPIVWTPFPNIITSTNGVFTFTDTNSTMGMKFYELLLLP